MSENKKSKLAKFQEEWMPTTTQVAGVAYVASAIALGLCWKHHDNIKNLTAAVDMLMQSHEIILDLNVN